SLVEFLLEFFALTTRRTAFIVRYTRLSVPLTNSDAPMEMDARSASQSKRPRNLPPADALIPSQIEPVVEEVLSSTPFVDIHTHLFSPAFGKLGLWGIDELLTYHYLEAEFFRSSDMPPDHYWKLSKREQADAIWQVLVVENTPISEATRGIIAVLKAFELPAESADLEEARSFFKAQQLESHVQRVLEMAGVSTVVMTNDPLNPEEQLIWMNGVKSHPQFQAV